MFLGIEKNVMKKPRKFIVLEMVNTAPSILRIQDIRDKILFMRI